VGQGFGTQWVEVELDTEASGFHLTCLQKACKISRVYIMGDILHKYYRNSADFFERTHIRSGLGHSRLPSRLHLRFELHPHILGRKSMAVNSK
jgi:hypothetical protein